MTEVEKFHKFLKDNTKRRSDDLESEVGLRLLAISRGFLEAAASGKLRRNWWELVKRKLPNDACLYDIGGGCLLNAISSNGCYSDAWLILLASTEWDGPGDNEPIPVLECPVFTREEVEDA